VTRGQLPQRAGSLGLTAVLLPPRYPQNRVIQHTVMYHSSTSNYTSNFVQIGKTICGRTNGGADRYADHTDIIRLTWRSLRTCRQTDRHVDWQRGSL